MVTYEDQHSRNMTIKCTSNSITRFLLKLHIVYSTAILLKPVEFVFIPWTGYIKFANEVYNTKKETSETIRPLYHIALISKFCVNYDPRPCCNIRTNCLDRTNLEHSCHTIRPIKIRYRTSLFIIGLLLLLYIAQFLQYISSLTISKWQPLLKTVSLRW